MTPRGWALGAVATLVVLVATAGGFLVGRRTPTASTQSVKPAMRRTEAVRAAQSDVAVTVGVTATKPTQAPNDQPTPMEQTAALERLSEQPQRPTGAPTSSPTSSPEIERHEWGCPEHAATLLPKIEPLIEDFKDERELALGTPWADISSRISKLDEIRKKNRALGPSPPSACEFRLLEKLDEAESFDIECLKNFLDDHSSCDFGQSRYLWVNVEQQLRGLREAARLSRIER